MTIQVTKNDIDSIFVIAQYEENYTIEEFEKAIKNPIEFNNGCCTAFAYHYAKNIDCIICDSTEYYEEIKQDIPSFNYSSFYHMFLNINDLYYDYECLNGVLNICELPFFKRLKEKLKN